MTNIFRDMFELTRIVVTVGLTEEGLFWKDEVPAAMAISYLEMEYPLRVVMSDEGGAQHYLRFAAPKAMNKDKKYGCTITFEGETLAVVKGEVNTAVEATRVAPSAEFGADSISRAKEVHNDNVETKLKLA